MIDSYRFGSIVIDGKEYQSDVIIFPDRVMDNWWRREGHKLQLADIEDVLDENPDLVIAGTGVSAAAKVLAACE